MLADYHVHTYYSDDSECPMEHMILQAISLKMDEIAFTEHVDYGVKTDLNCNYSKYFEEIDRLKQKYKNQLTIKAGIEFGVQTHTISKFREDAEKYPFEFIILSNHQINNQEFWRQDFQKGKSQREIYRRYYEAIYEVIKNYKDYSVLGHLDLIKRYDRSGEYNDDDSIKLIKKILMQVIQDGKGIEVNTSCFSYGLNDLTPSRKILALYYQMGGRIITIGSDAHDINRLGEHVLEVQKELIKIGFKEFCTFKNREPVFHKMKAMI